MLESLKIFLEYVYGKIEHKFISWFYSEYGHAQTDEEYEEFFNSMKEYAVKRLLSNLIKLNSNY